MGLHAFRVGLGSGLRLCLGLLIVCLIGLEVAQVVLRYFFAAGVIWGRDVSTLMMFSIAWLGAPLIWLERGHLAVDLLPSGVTGSAFWQRAMDVLVIASAFALMQLTQVAMDAFAFIDLPSLGTSAAIKFWPMTIGTALLAIAGVLNFLQPGRTS